MRINLEKIRETPFRWEETKEITGEALGAPEILGLSPVKWSGKVSFASPGFLLQAKVRYSQTLACDRCLEPFDSEVESDAELLLLLRPDEGEPSETGLREEDLGVWATDSELFELDEVLREQLLLGVPMRPLCRPDCRGLCPRCGEDLNRGGCSCSGEVIDPRWEALVALRDRLDGEDG